MYEIWGQASYPSFVSISISIFTSMKERNNFITTEYRENLYHCLQLLKKDDILKDADIVKIVEAEMQKNIENKIMKVHITNQGEPRKIKTPNENRKGLWSTFTPNRKEVTAATKEELCKKLYEYYFSAPEIEKVDYTFEEVWKEAHQHYVLRHADKTKTIQCHESDFRRYIDNDLRSKAISIIDMEYL